MIKQSDHAGDVSSGVCEDQLLPWRHLTGDSPDGAAGFVWENLTGECQTLSLLGDYTNHKRQTGG